MRKTPTCGKILKEQEIKTPTSSIDLYFNATDLSLFEGGFVTGPAFPAQRFTDDYVAKYGEKSTNFMTPFVYDVIDTLIKTYEKYDTKPSGEQISHDLLNLKDYTGIFGQVWVDEYGMFHNTPTAFDIKGGQFVPMTK